MAGKIFISYRRDDDPAAAARVRDGLARKFGNANLFIDIDDLHAGQRFDEELAKALTACDVLLAVIGERWMELLGMKITSGDRDYVREEIAAALQRRIVVIPVRVGREGQLPPLPRSGELPDDIRDLVLYQKSDVTHERFGRDIAELTDAIRIVRRLNRAKSAGRQVQWGWIGAIAALTLTIGYVGINNIPAWWRGSSAGISDPSASQIAMAEKSRAEQAASRADEEAALREPALSIKPAPLAWANNLGTALSTLGERESGTARLEQAVAAYRDALRLENTRARVPLDWAATQNNLGNTLAILGERESGTARLEEAVAAYREALMEYTRARVPLDWAATQNNLGNALQTLGERESGTARLEEAVAAYRDALEERTRARVPLDWAATQNNLGNTLAILGERESGTARLEEAVAAYREALMERTRQRVPLDWAVSFGSQGVALIQLAQRMKDVSMAQTAVLQIEAAFKTLRDGGHAPSAAYYERQLPEARRIRDALTGLSGQRENQGRTRPPNTKAR